MTVRQEAHGMIDRMPEENVQALIPLMAKLIPFKKKRTLQNKEGPSPKMQAFLEMQEMRKKNAEYDFSDQEREAAITEKFGDISKGKEQ
jgi:hypothetical protein